MAIIKRNDKEEIIKDNEPIKKACIKLNIPFSCEKGICGTCKIQILQGEENLDELTQEEKDMGDRDKTHRLACQAKIKQGTVIINEEE